jgi:hypothetical protein
MARRIIRIRLLTAVFACGIGVGAGIVNALRPASRSPGTPTASMAASEMSPAERALDRVVPEVWVVNLPLDAAAAKVSAASGVAIRVDYTGLADAHVLATEPITLRLRGASLAYVLNELVRTLEATWCIVGSEIVITNGDVAMKNAMTRVYDVHHLLPSGGPPPPVSVQGCFGPVSVASEGDIARLIEENIAPDTWRTTGGLIGSMRYFGGRLVIMQSADNHRAIRRLLSELNRPRSAPAPYVPEIAKDLYRWDDRIGRWAAVETDKTEAKLGQVIADLELDEVSLPWAISLLSKSGGASIVWQVGFKDTLEVEAGIKPVTVSLRGMTFASALRVVLDQAFKNSPFRPHWWLEGEVIVVGYRPPDTAMITRVYDMHDWLVNHLG